MASDQIEAPECWWIDHGSYGRITHRQDEADRATAYGKRVVHYITPADLAARVEAGAAAMRDRCKRACDGHADTLAENGIGVSAISVARTCATIIDTLPTDTTAYNAAIKAAYQQGWNDREGDFLAGAARIGIDDAAIKEAEERGMEHDVALVNECIAIIQRLEDDSATYALYGDPENARNRESMANAFMAARCALAVKVSAIRAAAGGWE